MSQMNRPRPRKPYQPELDLGQQPQNPHRSFPGPLRALSLEDLWEELEHWKWAIAHAPGWGAAVAAADEFQTACLREIERRKPT